MTTAYVAVAPLISVRSIRHRAGLHVYQGVQLPADTFPEDITRLLALGMIGPVVVASKSPRPRGAKAAEPVTLSHRQRSDLRADGKA